MEEDQQPLNPTKDQVYTCACGREFTEYSGLSFHRMECQSNSGASSQTTHDTVDEQRGITANDDQTVTHLLWTMIHKQENVLVKLDSLATRFPPPEYLDVEVPDEEASLFTFF